jgi:hypothetical protein
METLILARIVSRVWARGSSWKNLAVFPELWLSNEKIATPTCSVASKKLALSSPDETIRPVRFLLSKL